MAARRIRGLTKKNILLYISIISIFIILFKGYDTKFTKNILPSLWDSSQGRYFYLKYFYETQIDTYIYYRVPKPLFTSIRYKDMSALSKILYGLFLDRTTLSRANGWVDQLGRVYFYFSIEEVCEMLNISNKTAVKSIKELEKNDLLEKVRQGRGKPNRLYLGQYELCT